MNKDLKEKKTELENSALYIYKATNNAENI